MTPAELSRLSTLLDQALDLTDAEREPWLAALQGEGAALAPTLRKLLARHATAETADLLQRGPAFGPPPHGPQAGDVVGPYRLLRELGAGGMAAVWLAERRDGSLKRKVALKLPHLGWAPGLAERFARESDILSSLEHPHIARLYDAGLDPLGRPYMALEYVEGQAIDVYCGQQVLPVAGRLRLLLQVADAVAFAHGRLVLHRDLKPSNILVTADGQVRLLDFGVAKLMQGEGDPGAVETALTRASGRAMTPDYASPEQIRGEALGPTSDVYSLGVLAYELLAGQRPYRLPTSLPALTAALASLDPPAPSTRAADARQRAALRGDLDAIVLKALQREPARRYEGADALASDLRRHLQGQPVRVRPATVHQRAWRRLGRHRTQVAVGGAAAVVAGLGLAAGATAVATGALAGTALLALWQGALARRRAAEAEHQTARAHAAQLFLEGIFEPMSLARGDAATRERLSADDLLLRAAATLAGGGYGGDAELTTDLQGMLGRLLQDRALVDGAVELRQARVLGLQRLGAPPPVLARAQADLADSLCARGEHAAADTRMDSALALLQGAGGHDAAVTQAVLEARRAGLRLQRASDAPAFAALEQAIAVLRRLAPGGPDLTDALAMYATALSEHQHQADAAYAVAQEAVALLEQSQARQGPQHGAMRLRAAQLRYRIGTLMFVQRRYVEADGEVQQALELFRRIAGEHHPTTAIVAIARARMHTIHGRLGEALPLLHTHLPVLEAAAARIDPSQLGEARMALGEALLEEGRVAEALPALEAALATLRAAGPPIPRTVGALLVARALAETGRFDDALILLHETLATRVELWGDGHPSTALVMQRVGSVLGHAGRDAEAQQWLLRVAGTADVREHSHGSVKHRAAVSLVLLDVECGRFEAALQPAALLREALLALPVDQRPRPQRITIELAWLRARLGCGRTEGLEQAFDALMALSTPLFKGAPLRVAVRAVRVRWLAALGRLQDARAALAEVEEGFALQPLGPQFTRLLDEARAALAAGLAAPSEPA